MSYGLQQQIRRDLADLKQREANNNARIERDTYNHPSIYDLRHLLHCMYPHMNNPSLYFKDRIQDAQGVYNTWSNRIDLLDNDRDTRYDLGLYAHELGHAATLPHVRWSILPRHLGDIEYPSVAQQQEYFWRNSEQGIPFILSKGALIPRMYDKELRERHRQLYPWDTRYDEPHVPLNQHKALPSSGLDPEGYKNGDYGPIGEQITKYMRSTPERYTQLLRGDNFAFNRADSEMRDPRTKNQQAAMRKSIQARFKNLWSLPGTTAYYDNDSKNTKYYNMAPEFSKVLTDYQVTPDFDYKKDLRNFMPLNQMTSLHKALDKAETQYKYNNSGFNTDKGNNYLSSLS